MKNILASIWPVLAIDVVIYIIQQLLYGSAAAPPQGVPGIVVHVLSFGLVAVAAFLASRKSGQIKTAMIATALFWFVWRPLQLVVIGLPIGIVSQYLDADQAMQATLGILIASLLFSPVAFALGWIGGVVGRRIHQG